MLGYSQPPLPTNDSSREHLANLEKVYQIPQRTVCLLTVDECNPIILQMLKPLKLSNPNVQKTACQLLKRKLITLRGKWEWEEETEIDSLDRTLDKPCAYFQK